MCWNVGFCFHGHVFVKIFSVDFQFFISHDISERHIVTCVFYCYLKLGHDLGAAALKRESIRRLKLCLFKLKRTTLISWRKGRLLRYLSEDLVYVISVCCKC